MFFKKSVLNNFALFVGKYLCWSLFLIKLQPLGLQNRCFPVNIVKFLRTLFYETPPVAASESTLAVLETLIIHLLIRSGQWNKSLAMTMNLLLQLIMPWELLRERKPLFRWNTLSKNTDFNKNKIQVDRWSREYRNKICFWKLRIYKWNR